MRLAFLGTPGAAATCLTGLVDAGHDVAVVVTRPDKRRRRRGAPSPSPVKAAAAALGLPVAEHPDAVVDAHVELGVVVAYGRILRPPLLGSVPLVNVHFSLLPRWRGAAPVERAILAGDERTGVCLMDIEEGLDTGAVYRRAETAIGATETAAELVDRLAVIGRDLLVDALAAGLGEAEPQHGEPTHAAKVTPDDLRIDWAAGADHVLRQIRVGRAWTTIDRRRLLVHRAEAAPAAVGGPPGSIEGTTVSTPAGGVRLLVLQPEGRAALDAEAWQRGARPRPGTVLGS